MCAARGEGPEPPDAEEEFFNDPDHGAPGEWEELLCEVVAARATAAAEEEARRARLIAAGLDGDAHRGGARPGRDAGGPGRGLRQGCRWMRWLPAASCPGWPIGSGEDRAFTDVTDDQLMGLIGARQRPAAEQWEMLTERGESSYAAAPTPAARRRRRAGCRGCGMSTPARSWPSSCT